ncbi:hypothetical protein C8R43DRAFT_1116409 [Mycena crocata]|nr:hypothetical protein C8R43DRAFT_1116409 [Mycena crocata]
MREHNASPPSYNTRTSLDVRSVSELPTYSLEDEAAASPAVNTVSSAIRTVSADTVVSSPAPTLDHKAYSNEIRNSRAKSWATLTLLADPRLSRTKPIFVEGSNVTGFVKLNLQNREQIKSIIILATWWSTNFSQVYEAIWTTNMGDPRAPGPSSSSVEWKEKLQGDYHWPFSVKIPEIPVDLSSGERIRLPHSFAEFYSRANIEYYLELHINRGRFRSDDRLTTHFDYFSMRQPSRPSPMRQLAYQYNNDIPGPYADSDGWHALDAVQLRGKIFGKRTVFLAKPLCYTRGTSIPCAMTIETEDTQAVDILTSIKSSAVYLERSVKCTFGGSSSDVKRCGQATWWPSTERASSMQSSKRHIMGEIHLRKDLQPSAAIKEFRLEYTVVLFPFAAVAFKPEGSEPLIKQCVEIVTRFAPGPRARLATPPVYANDPIVDRYYASLTEAARRTGLRVKLWSPGG